ncbi:histidine phosphatase family protein [Amycolatopsis thermophila]|uniref:Broad specificity phosphatase PhoE n=1 Tax=Amycolatopsis thermophila TaxID=206084 RepID=A0ABU0F1T9_9PSEU|nr:histidine phosphatase family protein [Amycolatopsis thermophila]MDQ0381540.1 broad specificity phosphatase PhoE [Amycolatopsis thermophila]
MTEQVLAQPGLVPGEGAVTAGCRLYLVRHGTTTMNVENRYRGRRDVPLDAQGYQDAVDAARRLSGVGLTAVYTGPLRRTIATAQIIADESRVPDLRILHGLNNVDYGLWEGLTAEEARRRDPEAFELYLAAPSRAACPLGEKLTDAQDRMIDALRLIGHRHPGETVVAITHAVMIRLAVARLHGIDDETWRIPVGRGSLARFEVAGDRIGLGELPGGSDVD